MIPDHERRRTPCAYLDTSRLAGLQVLESRGKWTPSSIKNKNRLIKWFKNTNYNIYLMDVLLFLLQPQAPPYCGVIASIVEISSMCNIESQNHRI